MNVGALTVSRPSWSSGGAKRGRYRVNYNFGRSLRPLQRRPGVVEGSGRDPARRPLVVRTTFLRPALVAESVTNLDGKSAIVTGAGGGIGRGIALGMASAGARVAVADIDSQAAAETVSMIDASAAPGSIAIAADVGDVAQIDRMVATAVEQFGQLDVMVNNAGVTRHADVMDLTEEDFDRINRVNFKGVFFGLQRAAREMIPRREGAIVNIASIAGRGFAGASNVVYAGTKGAVITLTRLAAQQLAQHNLNVNAVCPGHVDSDLGMADLVERAERKGITLEEARKERRAERVRDIPLGRFNEPADIADTVVFLASPAARNITGQSINVDGGIMTS